MFRLLEFLLGSLLITVFTVASIFFFALHYLLRVSGIAECVWYGAAQTWLDLNGDGLPSPGEPPLSGVEIHVDDLKNQRLDISWPVTTDTDGEIRLAAFIPGCAETTFEIRVDIPDGYRLTTRARIEVRPDVWGSLETEPVYSFGFEMDR